MNKTLVATITEAAPLTQSKGEKIHDIKNFRIAIEEVNDFGLRVVKHTKVVLFDAVAKAADALGFKENDHIFLDDCRIEKRAYEKDGKTIHGEDIIATVVAKITAKQYAEISKKMAEQPKEADPSF